MHSNLPQWSYGFYEIHFRGKSGKKEFIFGRFFSCWQTSEFYQDTNATIDETSAYQELAVTLPKTELSYHNTTLRWAKETWKLLFLMYIKIGKLGILSNKLFMMTTICIHVVMFSFWY